MTNAMDYTIKYSKAQDPVPVVNGVHLHSIYNPQKEAETYIEKNKSIVDEKEQILILGLGFGYHLDELVKYITKCNFKKEIVIIEPNTNVFTDYLKIKGISQSEENKNRPIMVKLSDNITCYAGFSASELYERKSFIGFLIQKPGILPHPVSFNLYQTFFRGFLKFSANTTIESIKSKSNYAFIKNGLSHYGAQSSWDDIILNNKMNTKENIRFEVLLKTFEAIN